MIGMIVYQNLLVFKKKIALKILFWRNVKKKQ